MPVTTTETLSGRCPRLHCSRCSAEITVMGVADCSGGLVGACCARPADRASLASMGAGPETCVPLEPTFIAHDPLSHETGATHQAAAVLVEVRRKGARQAHPEVLAEVLAENPKLGEPWLRRGELSDIAMGPPPPAWVPGNSRPIGSHRAAQRE